MRQQGVEDCGAGGIGGVNDTPMAMTTLTGQVELKTAVFGARLFVAGEGHALIDQPLYGFAAVLYREPHRVFVTQATAGVEGVVDMRFNGIGIVQHGSNTALGPVGRAVGKVAFAQYRNAQMIRQRQCQTQTGSAAANHQNIVLKLLAHFRIPLKATRDGVGARHLNRRVETATQRTSI
ncbi:hypothetical protein EMIT0P176_160097 [Pseudomonas sp. IT-P176]